MNNYYLRNFHLLAKQLDKGFVSYWFAVIMALSVFLFAEFASAQDVTGAARAFSRAQKAELMGDHAMAAELFELADSLAPSPEALRSAVRSRKAAGQLVTAAIHSESLRKRYPYDTKSQELANAVLLLAKQTLMRFEIECKPQVCTLLVDDAAAAIEPDKRHVIYVEPGTHEIIASFDSKQSDPQFVNAEAGKRGSLYFIYSPETVQNDQRAAVSTEVNASTADTRVDSSETDGEGLSIWYFLSGAAVTLGAGAATIWSGLDVLDLHDEYKTNETQEVYESGLEKEERTNILIGITAAAGVVTCVLAIFTEWDSTREADSRSDFKADVGIDLNSGVLEVKGTF
ncbi:MAG: hypothetical protein JXA30_17520 [Deltaproteobacteria bacterium]|nr:hypothetical protein [Deltaproteobacteria bacterium]